MQTLDFSVSQEHDALPILIAKNSECRQLIDEAIGILMRVTYLQDVLQGDIQVISARRSFSLVRGGGGIGGMEGIDRPEVGS